MSSGVRPASAMAARQASTVKRERIRHEAPADARPPDATEDRPVLEALVAQRWARRRAAPARGRGRRGRSRRWARRAGSRRLRPARSGPSPPARCARPTGSHPTMLVVRCTRASSASATLATTYGGSKAGCHRCAFTVKPTIVPRPDTATGLADRLRQYGQIGTGGCTSSPQSSQPWMRRMPSAPAVQNHSLAGVSSGSGLIAPASRPAEGRSGTDSIDIDVVIEHRRAMVLTAGPSGPWQRPPVAHGSRPTGGQWQRPPASPNIDVNVEGYARHRRRLALVRAPRPVHQAGPGRLPRPGPEGRGGGGPADVGVRRASRRPLQRRRGDRPRRHEGELVPTR